jgi:hypothetical protein
MTQDLGKLFDHQNKRMTRQEAFETFVLEQMNYHKKFAEDQFKFQLELYKSLNNILLAVLRINNYDPAKLIEMSHEILANEEYGKKMMEMEKLFMEQNPGGIKIEYHKNDNKGDVGSGQGSEKSN